MYEINATALDQFIETHRQLGGGAIICYVLPDKVTMEFSAKDSNVEVYFYEDGKAKVTLETVSNYGEDTTKPIKKSDFY